VVVVEATPVEYRELHRAKMLTGKCWSSPVLSNNRVYVRSTVEAVSFEFSNISAPARANFFQFE
jgi:hypothetical protein